jgi:hypothetical protein
LQKLWEVDKDIKITAIVNTKTFRSSDEFPAESEKIAQWFPTEQDKGKIFVGFHMEGKKSLLDDKRGVAGERLKKWLKEKKVWVRQNSFNTMSMRRVGWIKGKHPIITNHHTMARQLAQHLYDTYKTEIPQFEIALFRELYVERDENGNKSRKIYDTMALEIRCEKIHATELKQFIPDTKLPTHLGEFIPIGLAHAGQGNLLRDAVRSHQHYIDTTTVIPIIGLSKPVMSERVSLQGKEQTIQEHLWSMEANRKHITRAIEETTLTQDIGKWFIAVNISNLDDEAEWSPSTPKKLKRRDRNNNTPTRTNTEASETITFHSPNRYGTLAENTPHTENTLVEYDSEGNNLYENKEGGTGSNDAPKTP